MLFINAQYKKMSACAVLLDAITMPQMTTGKPRDSDKT